MPRENNFLIGRGEQLTSHIEIKRRSGPKTMPYEFQDAKSRLLNNIGTTDLSPENS
jgi:hypothetical protein